MKVALLTGTRLPIQQGKASKMLDEFFSAAAGILIVGDCKTGVDAEGRDWAHENGIITLVAEAPWAFYAHVAGSSSGSGPARNKTMGWVGKRVEATGFAVPDKTSRGTFQAARSWLRQGIEVRIWMPDAPAWEIMK